MLDVENVKKILQHEVDKREKAKTKCDNYRSSGNKPKEDLYEKRYIKYCFRIDAMCDMLYDLGYLVWFNGIDVFVEQRVDGDIMSLVDEIPFYGVKKC